MYVPLLSSLTVSIFGGAAPVRAPFSLLDLDPRHTLVVRFESTDRLHRLAYRFEFHGHEVTLYDLGSGPPASDRRNLGTFPLSDDDLAGLDRLFAHYASRPSGSCPTTDRIRLVVKDGSRRLRSATYSGRSCTTPDVPGALALSRLAGRLTGRN